MRALEHVIQNMKTEVIYMNISRLTDYRKDGHPSVYRKDYKTSMKQNSSSLYEDCSHWCLPGVPDTWNELLYVSLLKYGKGTWKIWGEFLIIIRQTGFWFFMHFPLVFLIYEARTLLRLDLSRCRTHVVSDTDTTPTHIITLNYVIFGVSVPCPVSVSISVLHSFRL